MRATPSSKSCSVYSAIGTPISVPDVCGARKDMGCFFSPVFFGCFDEERCTEKSLEKRSELILHYEALRGRIAINACVAQFNSMSCNRMP